MNWNIEIVDPHPYTQVLIKQLVELIYNRAKENIPWALFPLPVWDECPPHDMRPNIKNQRITFRKTIRPTAEINIPHIGWLIACDPLMPVCCNGTIIGTTDDILPVYPDMFAFMSLVNDTDETHIDLMYMITPYDQYMPKRTINYYKIWAPKIYRSFGNAE